MKRIVRIFTDLVSMFAVSHSTSEPRVPGNGMEPKSLLEFPQAVVSFAAMNLRVWLIAGILCGLTAPSSLAESGWPIPEISFSPHAGADRGDEETKNCDTGKEPGLRI
ncbi:MAG TPA: hypothetical protein VH024_00900, partial [Candidatus Angelobacter sp.]|nr:hypothetical protein [Candidatus Angelobacter sp.]